MPIKLEGHHTYEIEDRPGARLCVGVQPGQVRPTLWVEQGADRATLASFHGAKHALAAVHFLDAMVGQINRAIEDHLPTDTNDTNDPNDTDGTDHD